MDSRLVTYMCSGPSQTLILAKPNAIQVITNRLKVVFQMAAGFQQFHLKCISLNCAYAEYRRTLAVIGHATRAALDF